MQAITQTNNPGGCWKSPREFPGSRPILTSNPSVLRRREKNLLHFLEVPYEMQGIRDGCWCNRYNNYP
jgi:hypothetical protein